MVWVLAVAVGVLGGAVMAVLVPRVRIDDDEAPDFAALVSPRSVIAVASAGFVAAQVLRFVDAAHWWVWVPYLGVGAAMAYVDLRTTFLPRVMNTLALGLMAAGAVIVGFTDWRALVGSAIGAVAAFAILWLVWRFSPGLGYGDVRLALLIGAVAGLGGVQMWTTSLFLGTLIGAVHGIGHAIWARRDPGRPRYFPYGPALWSGPVIAAVILGVA